MRGLPRAPVSSPPGLSGPCERSLRPLGRQGLFAFGLALLGFVLGDAALHEEVYYAEAGYALALLAALAPAGFGALLLLRTLRRGDASFGASAPTFPALPETNLAQKPSGTGLPILLTLLLLPLSALFSGLAGWVEARA